MPKIIPAKNSGSSKPSAKGKTGKLPVLTPLQKEALRADGESIREIKERLIGVAKSLTLLLASIGPSKPDYQILAAARKDLTASKLTMERYLSSLEERLIKQDSAESHNLALDLHQREVSRQEASKRVHALHEHNLQSHSRLKQARLMSREGHNGPTLTYGSRPAAPPMLKPALWPKRGVRTSTPKTSSSSGSSSDGAPKKAVPRVARTGRRRSPRLIAKAEAEKAKDKALIKRYQLKQLKIVVERLPKKKMAGLSETPTTSGTPPSPKSRPTSPKVDRANAIVDPVLNSILDDVFEAVSGLQTTPKPGPSSCQHLERLTQEDHHCEDPAMDDWLYSPPSMPAVPSPSLAIIEHSNGTTEVVDLRDSPFLQARQLEMDPLAPMTPEKVRPSTSSSTLAASTLAASTVEATSTLPGPPAAEPTAASTGNPAATSVVVPATTAAVATATATIVDGAATASVHVAPIALAAPSLNATPVAIVPPQICEADSASWPNNVEYDEDGVIVITLDSDSSFELNEG